MREHQVQMIRKTQSLTLLMAGYSKHRTWWKRLLSRFKYIPLEEYLVAYFTEAQPAYDYIDWADLRGRRPPGQRFRNESVLAGYDRAWCRSFFTNVPVNPVQTVPEENN